jgi:hypothetical protein
MKKLLILTAILTAFSATASQNDMVERQPTMMKQTLNIISSKTNELNTFQFIVKFQSEAIHNSLIQTPETNKMIIKRSSKNAQGVSKSAIQAMSKYEFTSKYNLSKKTDSFEGVESIETLENDLDISIKHVRSLALGRDLLEVSTALEADILMKKLLQHDLLVEVTANRNHSVKPDSYSTTDFNDSRFSEQPYFGSQADNIANGNYSKMKENEVNNLGRNIRVAVIDSGSADHEDMKPISDGIKSGYDFITHVKSGITQSRSENHKDGVTVDGEVLTVGHAIAVASTIGAISNNSIGLTGIVDSNQVDIIYGKVCSAFGCSNVAINDAIHWASGGHIAGVPDIDTPVDVINLSLSGFNYAGCDSYTQEIIDYAYNKGITIFVAAGNDSKNAENLSPAACENVITVGALTRDLSGDKASFSNYGDKVDISAIGHNVLTAKLDSTNSGYQITSGTSFSAPIVAGVGINLKLKYPELTPAQIERILKNSSYKITSSNNSKDCEMLGCGSGSLDAYEALMSIDHLLTANTGKAEHLYQNEDSFYVAQMNQIKNVCNLNKISIGSIGSQLDGAEYKVYTGFSNTLYTSTTDPVIVVETTDTIAYQACFNGTCGDITEVYTDNVVKPTFCN